MKKNAQELPKIVLKVSKSHLKIYFKTLFYETIFKIEFSVSMVPQPRNGMIQVVLDTVNSVQLKMKKLPTMTDEAREKQIKHPKLVIDPFTNQILLTTVDWIFLLLGTVFLAPFRAIGVVMGLGGAWLVAKIGLIGLSASEMASNVSRSGWRRKLMNWYEFYKDL